MRLRPREVILMAISGLLGVSLTLAVTSARHRVVVEKHRADVYSMADAWKKSDEKTWDILNACVAATTGKPRTIRPLTPPPIPKAAAKTLSESSFWRFWGDRPGSCSPGCTCRDQRDGSWIQQCPDPETWRDTGRNGISQSLLFPSGYIAGSVWYTSQHTRMPGEWNGRTYWDPIPGEWRAKQGGRGVEIFLGNPWNHWVTLDNVPDYTEYMTKDTPAGTVTGSVGATTIKKRNVVPPGQGGAYPQCDSLLPGDTQPCFGTEGMGAIRKGGDR